jgi:hypothetical protein
MWHACALILMLLLLHGFETDAAVQPAAAKPATGRMNMTFSERSPFSSFEQARQRLG